MTRNNIGQFSRSLWSKVKSTFKFTFWLIRLLFTKEGIKQITWIIGLGLAMLFVLIQIEWTGWNQAINLTSNLFNKPVTDYSINIPHAQDSIDNLLRWNFGSEAQLAKAIFKSESGLRCTAEGDKDLEYTKDGLTYGASYGIAQIRYLPGRPTPNQLKDCKFAIQYAKQLRDRSGWSIWSAYKNKSYLKNI